MAVTPPKGNWDVYYPSTAFPPVPSDPFWQYIFEAVSTGGGYHQAADPDPVSHYLMYGTALTAGTATIQNKRAIHHTEDGTYSSFIAVCFDHPLYNGTGDESLSNCYVNLRVEGGTSGKWMQVRMRITGNSYGYSGGDNVSYFQDSEGINDQILVFADYGDDLYLQFRWYADGSTYIRFYNITTGTSSNKYMTSDLFAYDEEITYTITWETDTYCQSDRYLRLLYMDVDVIIGGPVISLLECPLASTPTLISSATVDNETVEGGILQMPWQDPGSDRQALFDEYFESCFPDDPGGLVTFQSTRTDLRASRGYMWLVKLKAAIHPSDSFETAVSGYGFDVECFVLANADRSNFVVFANDRITSYNIVIMHNSWDADNPFYRGSVDLTRHVNPESQTLKIEDGEVTYTVNTGTPTDSVTVPLSLFFGDEPIYFWLALEPGYYIEGSSSVSTAYLYVPQIFIGPMFARNPEQGQSPANDVRGFAPLFSMEASEDLAYEYVCYFKNKIINTIDSSDDSSLVGMVPGYPSDLGLPLKPGDACLVHEKYNRLYFYQMVAGDMPTDLPDVYRIDETMHWEMTDCVTQNTMSVEQYDVVGLVDTNDVIVTHSAHNRVKSYCPAIQLLHNNVVRTHGITVSVISNTQLRLATEETAEITGLKINIYITT